MSSKARRERDKKGKRIGLRVLAIVGVLLGVLLVVGAVAAYLFVADSLKGLPNVNDPNAFNLAQPTKIYSADGKLLANFYLENRDVIPLSQMSPDVQHAIVAVEDERFYQHNGVDFVGIARAIWIDLSTGSASQGASTITQEYIRNTILAKERYQITITRKIREAYLAWEFEKTHTKAEVLQDYLNTVYFGDGAYGVEAASLAYFDKNASDLTLAQAALIAGLPQSPVYLDPYTNLSGARARQHAVLSRMVANAYITQAQATAAKEETITLKSAADPNQGIYDCGYFVAYVRKVLLQQYSNSLVYTGGLQVYTTIDTRLERAAEKAVKKILPGKKDPDSALISINPKTGAIVAMYGGRDYSKNQFNMATQGRRQAGSSFKTFTLVTALELGIPPNRPMDASSPAVIPSHPPWIVHNDEGSGKGYMTISTATANSVNCVFARLIWEIGASKVVATAHTMGITSYIPDLPSITLGTAPVSPLEMASAYGTLADNGVHVTPTSITKIVDSTGATIFEASTSGTRVLTPQIAWATTQLLEGVVRGGTGTAAALSGREVAGKTGTTSNYQDAWFVGYTPQLVTAVWMGYSKGAIPMRSVHGRAAFGGTFCAPIWHLFMNSALKGLPAVRFARATAPHYIWKAAWSSAAALRPKPKPKPPGDGGGTTTTPTPPTPPTPPTTTTP